MSTRTIRPLSVDEVVTLVDWAAAEGWNPGLSDAYAFHAADPCGFLGAFVGDDMVAGISAAAYGSDYGFIGLYICRPDRRGQGHGKAVWNAGMEYLKGRTVGLDGVDAQLANYRAMGFRPSYRTIRWSGAFDGAAPPAGLAPVAASNLPDIRALDARYFPAPRDAFLARWLAPPHVALAIIENGALSGYAVARRCRQGVKIGPLVATTDASALRLLSGLAANVPGEALYIDVPEPAAGFARKLEHMGFTPGFVTTRMYRGTPPDRAVSHAVASLELG